MAGEFAYDTLTRVDWVVTIANTAAPTAAELNAGTNLSTFVSKDGVQPGLSSNNVDVANISSNFDAQVVGSYGGTLNLRGFRKSTDTFWTLQVYGTIGHVVIRRGTLYSTAYSAAQKVEVYPAQMHEPIPDNSAANTSVMFTAPFAITGTPQLKATVA
jgi:hypothetical protein